jgi:prepilin-type N-terminal cleavage/methylation domain-containing protein
VQVNRGFTVVELLVTVSIVAVLLGLAVPSFRDLFERQRLETVADTIISDLRAARAEAISRGPEDSLMVEFTTASGSWSYTVTDAGGTVFLQRTSDDLYGASVVMTVANTAFGDTDLDGKRDFSLDALRGLALDGAGAITLTSSSGYDISVVRNLLGKVDMCSDSMNGYPTC